MGPFAHPLFILTVLCVNVVVSEWLVRHTFFKHFGSALLVIVVTAVTANLGVIPTNSTEAPIYSGVFTYVAPLAIFWLLLPVNLRSVLRAGFPMLAMFLIGSAGTVVGVVVAMKVIGGAESIGELYRPLGAAFVGTYTGGSVNFNALALHYGLVKEGVLYGAATAADNILTALWMVVTIAVPRFLSRYWPAGIGAKNSTSAEAVESSVIEDDTESVHPIDVGVLLAAGSAAIWLADLLADWLSGRGVNVPSVLILTTFALVLAQIPAVNRLRGTRVLGMFSVYLFLAVIGAYCDVAALSGIGRLGATLLVFVMVVVFIHGVITFVLARLFRIDVDVAAVASQANIGGATSALALARSLSRPDLVLPAVLVGSLGYGIGTYLGFFAAAYLL